MRFDLLLLLLLGTLTKGFTRSLYIGLSTLSIFVTKVFSIYLMNFDTTIIVNKPLFLAPLPGNK
jgi:hypothetical protein